jgi:hypothetical protein
MTAAARRTFTRTQLHDALAAVGRSDIADGLYSLRMDSHEGRGPSAVALGYDVDGDLGVFIAVVSRLLGPDWVDFAASTRTRLDRGMPARHFTSGAAWPGWVLDEPTWEQWVDIITECHECEQARCCDEEPTCEDHAAAPWDRTPATIAQ